MRWVNAIAAKIAAMATVRFWADHALASVATMSFATIGAGCVEVMGWIERFVMMGNGWVVFQALASVATC
ncbi:hypothetical protein GCM10023156_09320 [Novipirellula rosea]|uniref:Uncharacterized protein n=1 Tax=Novipirellula rosea TaxID=1031540 RepID=A0ABP8MDS7_9BACT